MFNRWLLFLNSFMNRLRRPHAPARHILLLLPHCLQRTTCEHNVVHDLDRCVRCGGCSIADLIALWEEYGVQCCLAAGGREAIAYARRSDIKVVVAVACDKELAEGVRAAFPKPVVTVSNLCPHGPCKNTEVDVEEVRRVLEEIILPVSTP